VKPDLVVTDVMMPNLDGFGLLRALRSDGATSHIPVMMLSARAGEESRVEGFEAGADDYLVKPFTAREVVARVEAQILRARIRSVEDEHRRRLSAVFSHAPVPIAIMRGPAHVYELANDPYQELIGHRDVIGKTIREALPELEGQGICELLDQVYASGERLIGRSHPAHVRRGADGSLQECFFDFVYQPTLDAAGQVDGIAVVAFDVTALVNARQAAEDANRAKDEFLAMLGHELRNPLAPILTALQLLRLRGVDAGERERTIIERQVRHLVGLVDDLLDISRITRGKVRLKRVPMQLSDAVAKGIELASPLLEQHQHTLEVSVPARGLPVLADPDRLAQVISNLLTNSAKYTTAGGQIRVSAAIEGAEVVLRVADSGIGIDPAMLPRIFDLFTQDRQAIDRAQGGLGLGLSIVRSLVTLHGGTVAATSEGRGHGSEFVVRLPRAAADVGSEPLPVKDGAPPVGPSGVRVLIVDDNVDAALLLGEALTQCGHEIRIAGDGLQALHIASSFRPHVALLDIGLPVMDGFEVARQIRESPELAAIRLVAVTGYGQVHDRERTLGAGFDVHLVKPVDLQQVSALIAQLADKSAVERLPQG
jgi:signal transduction histidine kinase/DNA-binding response OmpR family regulator